MRYDVNPPKPPLTKNMSADLCPYPYVPDLAAEKEALSSHAKIKCVMISYTPLDKTHPITLYKTNTSSTRAASDQRRRHVRGGED